MPTATTTTTSPVLPPGYTLRTGVPPVPAYRHLRAASGLSPVTESQAAPVSAGTWYGCYVIHTPPAVSEGEEAVDEVVVGMGRIISDGGWYFHIADMAVLPEHQRRGLGDAVLKELLARIRAVAPEGKPYVNLFADPPGRKLYQKNGLVESAPKELGMVMPNDWRSA